MSTEEPEIPKKEKKATDAASQKTSKQAGSATPLAEKIGFAKLDLTVDEVEERISPRETNVFDK